MRASYRLTAVSALAAAALTTTATAAFAQDTEVSEPDTFTSMFTAMATPDMVIGMTGQPAPGEPGATGTFNYRVNSDQEIICYDLTLSGVTGEYMSPARTATHVHEAQPGKSGPPRLAFPNPSGESTTRTSSGCMQGPFTTGVVMNGQDTGANFSLKKIEADPSAFFGDSHTAQFTAGVVRGQLTAVPMGGVETGAGTTAGATAEDAAPYALGAAALVAAGAAGAVAHRRNRAQA